jgi:hypothetical protein
MVFQHLVVINIQLKHYKLDAKTDLEYTRSSHEKSLYKTYKKTSANRQKT